ncbi:MAG: pyruvate kinase [Sulfuricurvum sp.]|uniref:pyruvate kinase n=1 Tax=Sulfuricurvum sp. TaxID=2025608 RepID=UPI00356AEDFC
MLDQALMHSALEDLQTLRSELLAARENMDQNHPHYKSLLNLRQYLILRSQDLTRLQEKLFMLSLSSLGRSFAHVAASIDTLYDQLNTSLGQDAISEELSREFHHLSIAEAMEIAARNSQALFGGKFSTDLSRQTTAVMVTLPSHAAQNEGALIRQLAHSGVNVFRINTAHDTPDVWQAMADVIAQINTGREPEEKIKIFVDLAGPKIRTGEVRQLLTPLAIGSNKREKEILIRHTEEMTKPESVDPVSLKNIPAQISIKEKLYNLITMESIVLIVDANGKNASVRITEITPTGIKGFISRKVFIDHTSTLSVDGKKRKIRHIAPQTDPIRLFTGDELIITEKEIFGRSALLDEAGNVLEPAVIRCSFGGMLSAIQIRENIFIDDGKIALKVISNDEDSVRCRVINAKSNGTLLKAEKGINFPDTYIKTPAITDADRENALSVLGFADSLSISFCQSAEDIRSIQKLLLENGRNDIGIIAKIETKQAVSAMPEILSALLDSENSGVMIARGDLAIEVGFENMAYIQEALLDICDAAHLPVIWATQVLESKMKSNLPSRAEVTDAAMAGRAECVMLNKGAFAIDTIDVLTRILDDMHRISKKNKQLLQRETLWNI